MSDHPLSRCRDSILEYRELVKSETPELAEYLPLTGFELVLAADGTTIYLFSFGIKGRSPKVFIVDDDLSKSGLNLNGRDASQAFWKFVEKLEKRFGASGWTKPWDSETGQALYFFNRYYGSHNGFNSDREFTGDLTEYLISARPGFLESKFGGEINRFSLIEKQITLLSAYASGLGRRLGDQSGLAKLRKLVEHQPDEEALFQRFFKDHPHFLSLTHIECHAGVALGEDFEVDFLLIESDGFRDRPKARTPTSKARN